MFIDAHTHIQFPAFDGDRGEAVARAKAAGVQMIAVGTQTETSRRAISFAHACSGDAWATVGFHPGHAAAEWFHDKKEQRETRQEQFDPEALRLLARDPKVVAIGECGLDYYRVTSDRGQETRKRQKDIFLAQVEIARELNKPLMIHCRPSKGTDDAYEDLRLLLESYALLPRILHFYVGSPAMTKKLIDAGFYFTFGGVVTFSRDYDEAIAMIPFDRILLETDAPYVAPEPFRGKRNEPAYVVYVAKRLAEIKGASIDEAARQTAETARRAFRLF